MIYTKALYPVILFIATKPLTGRKDIDASNFENDKRGKHRTAENARI
jgi:hypothetical protein